ncbi:MAG: hypothetical protein U9Q19_10640 [Pseudomonadota bacterium]|nr:hypothetical protein [Pseudomonadota bacterium]
MNFHLLILLIAKQILALMVVGGDSHEHPMQVTDATLLKVVVQALLVLITLVSVYGNRMAVTITVRLCGDCRGTPIPTA